MGDPSRDEGPMRRRKEDELTDPRITPPTVSSQFQRPHGRRVIVHATRHSLRAEEVHREEHERFIPNQREGEMPAGERSEYIRRDIRGNQK